jgi:ATP-dependent helicase/nuclease subunit A
MNTSIRASAGSGKTYALTTEYLRLLWRQHQAGELRPEAILASTFTRKAAGEIFDRILSRLAAAVLNDQGLTELTGALDDKTLTRETCENLLLDFCRHLDRVSVGTLDSFFQRLCHVYRQETGLAADTRLTDPNSPQSRALHQEAIRSLLDSLPTDDVVLLLDDLHGSSAAPSPILGAFDSLLKNLWEQAAEVPPAAWSRLDLPTRPGPEMIQAACDALEAARPDLPNGHWRNAVRDDLKRFGDGQWEKFCGAGVASACLDPTPTYRSGPVAPDIQAHYAILLAAARNELLPPIQRRTHAIRDLLTRYTRKFQALRETEGLMLFSEAPRRLAQLMAEMDGTFQRLDAPIDHVLLDEFQDTSYPQYHILRGFARRAATAPGSVFLVGDMKQAIYGWRGGRAEIFELAEAEIADMQSQSMDSSYRSSPAILHAVNTLFGSLEASDCLASYRTVTRRWQEFFAPHQAHKATLRGYVELSDIPMTDAAASIAARVQEMPTHMTIGVLARKNTTVSTLTDSLRAHGLDVGSEGIGAIADDPAVEIILSALMLADHPGHTAAAYHLAHSPLADLLGVPQDLHTQTTEAAKVSTAIRRDILTHGYVGLIASWAVRLAPFGTERTARRLEQLLDLAGEYDRLPPMRASEFVAAVRQASVENPGSARIRVMTINRAKGLEFDAVFLPELDWSAGAIRPACLILPASVAALAAGAPPVEAVHTYPRESLRRLSPALALAHQAYMDEEVTGMLCLLYVAMTRARQALHLFVGTPGSGVTPGKILREVFGRTANSPGADEKRLYSHGDQDWHLS